MKKLITLASIIFITAMAPLHVQAETRVLGFAGSSREGSYNKLLLKEASEMAQQAGTVVKVIDLKDYPLPFFDEDLESQQGMPEKAKELRNLMVNSQIIIIASPEYNASIPAVLKNALDWASRNEEGKGSRDAYKGKVFVLLSASPGKTGGSRGLVHLKAIIEDVGGKVYLKQFSLPAAYQAFDDQGHLKDAQQRAELQQLVQEAFKSQ